MIKKYKINLVVLMVLSLIVTSCADLEVENENDPDFERAISSPDDLVTLIEGSMVNLLWSTMTFQVVNYDLQADIITSTNAASNYWGDADEPRRQVNNLTTFDDKSNNEFTWNGGYVANTAANNLIKFVEVNGNDLILSDGTDATAKTLAAAYMMKGIGIGYVGYIYDKGYIVDVDTDINAVEYSTYAELIQASIGYFEKAKAIYAANPDVVFDYITDSSLSAAEAIQLANSYAARFLIGQARTNAEAETLDYNSIKTYASGGLEADWSPTSDGTIIYNGQHSWNTFTIDDDGAAYLPVDLQIPYLFSTEGDGPEYAKTYPSSGLLEEAVTDDARIDTDFFYTQSLGWLREDRNRSIFSNYTYYRYEYNYASSNSGSPMHIITASEMDMIEAEAEVRLGNYAAAKTIIDNGARTVRGGLAPLADANQETLEHAVWYENIIELHSSGCGIALAYMRRWDRMQEGSYLHLPVPGFELEIANETNYTYGGAGNGAQEGTASGSNAWK